jgi:hypothetical protein
MAIARLINPTSARGATIYEVDTWPFEDRRFHGPDTRDWADFVLTADGAEFEWRTGADKVREAAEKVVAGTWTVQHAKQQEPAVADWLERRGRVHWDLLKDEDPGLADPTSREEVEELERRVLVCVGLYLDNESGGLGYYEEDDDSYLDDAARALDLPSWAHVANTEEGGPGSGYMAAAIVLTDGRDLEDLAEWLAAQRVGR